MEINREYIFKIYKYINYKKNIKLLKHVFVF